MKGECAAMRPVPSRFHSPLIVLLLGGLALAGAPSASAQPAPAGAAETVVVRAGSLIDGRGDPPRRDQAIVIRGRRIESVGDAGRTPIPPGAHVLDLGGATVLPGL